MARKFIVHAADKRKNPPSSARINSQLFTRIYPFRSFLPSSSSACYESQRSGTEKQQRSHLWGCPFSPAHNTRTRSKHGGPKVFLHHNRRPTAAAAVFVRCSWQHLQGQAACPQLQRRAVCTRPDPGGPTQAAAKQGRGQPAHGAPSRRRCGATGLFSLWRVRGNAATLFAARAKLLPCS